MKTPDEIKKSLECMKKAFDEKCDFKCDKCPVYVPGYKNTSTGADALAYIWKLEAELADAKLNHQHAIDIAEKQRAQIGKLKKIIVRISIEKKGLESIIRGFPDVCRYCKNNDGEFCKGNPDAWGTCFEWIGIPSRTEVSPDA